MLDSEGLEEGVCVCGRALLPFGNEGFSEHDLRVPLVSFVGEEYEGDDEQSYRQLP